MAVSERIMRVFEAAQKNWENPPQSTYNYDRFKYSFEKYSACPLWEKIARSNADAMVNQKVYIEENDKIFGRVFHANEKQIEKFNQDLDYKNTAIERVREEIPNYDEMVKYQISSAWYSNQGHIAWNWNKILQLGTSGIADICKTKLAETDDEKAKEFYRGALIMLESVEKWNDKHIEELLRLGRVDDAEICKRVPKYPARNFREAIQAFYFQYICVMRENPYGGNSPGRLDYYLWPYLKLDLENGNITREEAKDLIDELFIRIDERIHKIDHWGESVVVGGTNADGSSAVTVLTEIMIESIMSFDITHPYLYARIPEDAEDSYLDLCAKYVKYGNNRAQLLYDKNVISALLKDGVPLADAIDYCCGGCMEIGIQGKTSDFLFNGWQNITKILELATTGGYSLVDDNKLESINPKGLMNCRDFEDYYNEFINLARYTIGSFLKVQDIYSEGKAKNEPAYLISTMIDDCIEKGRNMHDGGARYHDYGSTTIGIPNSVDYLMAVKKAVFDEKFVSAEELIKAMSANFVGYEDLQRKLKQLPRFGCENAEADAMAIRLVGDISNIFTSYRNRLGGKGKIIILTFTWAPAAGWMLGATAYGDVAGKPVAHGITPQGASMTKGITAAINSCTEVPFDCFNGGASTMWDLDEEFAKEPVIKGLFMTFFKRGGQIYQGNTTDLESLYMAQEHPEDYYNLIVRVGGYSARFVTLGKALQDEIINRIRHKG